MPRAESIALACEPCINGDPVSRGFLLGHAFYSERRLLSYGMILSEGQELYCNVSARGVVVACTLQGLDISPHNQKPLNLGKQSRIKGQEIAYIRHGTERIAPQENNSKPLNGTAWE